MEKRYSAWFIRVTEHFERVEIDCDDDRAALYERCKTYLINAYGDTDRWIIDDGYRLEHPQSPAVIVSDPDIIIWSEPHDPESTVAAYLDWESEFIPFDKAPSTSFEEFYQHRIEEYAGENYEEETTRFTD